MATKIDSANTSPTSPKHKKQASVDVPSSPDSKRKHNPDVHSITDLEKEGVELKIAPETQKLNWKINTSPTTLDEPAILKKPLTTPLIKKIDLHFPLGLEVTARNLKGVTIKDALDAIHKQFKKRPDEELENPILEGFEWDKEECYTRFVVHLKKEGQASSSKKKGKKGE